jgi:hypothetical protein
MSASAKVESVELRTIPEGGDDSVLGISHRDRNMAVEGDFQEPVANPDAVNLGRNLQCGAEPGRTRSSKALFQIRPHVRVPQVPAESI